jgi:response regulator RpfG family c-di-GMP phosphodiesterase
MEHKYQLIDLNFLLRDSVVSYDIYIKVNDRYIRFLSREYTTKEELQKLKNKGIDSIYLNTEDHSRYLEIKAQALKEIDPVAIVQKNAALFVKNNELLQKLFKSLGYHDDKVKHVLKSVEYSRNIWENSDSLLMVKESFLNISEPYMVKKQLEIFVILSMAKYLQDIDEKKIDQFISGIICMDLKLNDQDYWNCYDKNKLSNNLLNHSLHVVEYLPSGFFYNEISGFIKSHHETVDGQGYPLSFKTTQLSFYNVFYNIVDDFTYFFLHSKTKVNKVSEIIDRLEKKYMRYTNGKESIGINKLLKALNAMDKGGFDVR